MILRYGLTGQGNEGLMVMGAQVVDWNNGKAGESVVRGCGKVVLMVE